MKKWMNILSKWVDTVLMTLPIGWVITCYDGGWEYYLSGSYLKFLWHLICGTIFAILLLGFGSMLAGFDFEKEKVPSPPNRWMAFAIELGVLFIVTCRIIPD